MCSASCFCSVAHNTHSIWTNTVGLEQAGGNNAAVENSLNAPQFGGGRASRRAAAAEVVEKTGKTHSRVHVYSFASVEENSKSCWTGFLRDCCLAFICSFSSSHTGFVFQLTHLLGISILVSALVTAHNKHLGLQMAASQMSKTTSPCYLGMLSRG